MNHGEIEFFTVTCLNWQTLLKEDKHKQIILNSLTFLVKDERIWLYAYVIMPNHMHILWRKQNDWIEKNVQQNFLKYTGSDKADGFAIQSWAAGLFFKAAVEKAVAENGSNSITRADVLSASASINRFNAGGLIGKTNVGMREPTPCYVLMQVKGGKFVRVTPSKPGTFNCQSKNIVDIKQSLIG